MSDGDVAGVQSVDRALMIPEHLARSGEAGVTEIAAELGVRKSFAFRLVATLESHRLVEQTEGRGKDRLEVGLTAAAAPIRNVHGDVVASMSVSLRRSASTATASTRW
jgi:DNA-binding IclR family transcriptional regulator